MLWWSGGDGELNFRRTVYVRRLFSYFHSKSKEGLSTVLRLCGWDSFVQSFSCVILHLFLKEDVKLEKFHCLPFSLQPLDYRAKKLPTLTELGTYCTHIFKIIFSTSFLKSD